MAAGKPSRRASPLTDSQARFASEYLIDLNGKQAAIRAGYSPKTAEVQASRLLRSVQVADSIAKGKAAREKRIGITQDRVLEELSLLAFSDVTHYLIDDVGNVELAEHAPVAAHRAISSIKRRVTTDKEGAVTREVEVKLWDKPGPLRLAGRHVGLFNDDETLKKLMVETLAERLAEARARVAQNSAAVPVVSGLETKGA